MEAVSLFCRGAVQRGVASGLAGVDRALGLEQKVDDIGVAAGGGGVDRQILVVVGGAKACVGASGDEIGGERFVAEKGRQVQPGPAVGGVGEEDGGVAVDRFAGVDHVAHRTGGEEIDLRPEPGETLGPRRLAHVDGPADRGNIVFVG